MKKTWEFVGATLLVAGSWLGMPEGSSAQIGSGYVPPDDQLIPLGTTRGQRYGRLVIRGVTIVDGRGSPRRVAVTSSR